eukprot:123035_1
MEIQIRNEELESNLVSIETKIQALSKVDDAQRPKKLKEIENLLANASRNLKHIDLECRTLPADEKPKFKQILKEQKSKLRELQTEFKWARSTEADAENDEGKDEVPELADMGGEKFMEYGHKVQKETLDAQDRTIQMIEQTKETGAATAAKLHEQTAQIQRAYDELYEIDDNLERANRIVRRMMRRVFTDKYIWCFMFLILATIVGIIVLKATGYSNIETSIPV